MKFKDVAVNEYTEIKEKRIMAAWIEEVDQLGRVVLLFNQTLNENLLRKDWFDHRTFELSLKVNSDVPLE